MASPDRADPAGPGGPPPGPNAPGWYPDPNRLEVLRYWDGTGWTSRQRPRPAWVRDGSSVVVAEGQTMIDGPVRLPDADGPAATTAAPSRESTAPSRESAGGPGSGSAHDPDTAPDTGGRRPGSSGGTGDDGGGTGGGHGGGPGGGGPSPDDGDSQSATHSRRKWLLIAGVAVMAAVVVGISGEAMRPESPGPRVLTDRTYVMLANADCARTLPGLRPPDSGPFGQFNTPAQTAAQIERASLGLDRLADRLRALPGAPADRPRVDAWLDGWHRYGRLGRQYATFLRQRGEANPGKLRDDIVREANRDDNFALANGLKDCTFFATPRPDPSNGF